MPGREFRKPSKPLRNTRPGVLVALAALALLCPACSQKHAGPDPGPEATLVTAEVARAVPVAETSEYLATLKSRRSAAISPQVEGQVTRIYVQSGDRVAAGAPLLEIDPRKQQATVKSQEATRAAQVANLAYVQDQFKRAKKLFEAGVISRQEMDAAQTALDTAKAQLEALDAQVREQQVQLHYYEVAAPTGGVVGDIPVRVGDRVTTATVLTTLDQPGELEAYIAVPVERARELRLGQPVELLDDSGAALASSRISFISAEVDTPTQTILAKAQVSNAKGALRTAELARARLTWSTKESLVIPVLSVARINGQFFAFLVEKDPQGQVARQRLLHVGEMTGKNYVVLGGIKPGEHVITSGIQSLVDGMRVTETPAASSPGNP